MTPKNDPKTPPPDVASPPQNAGETPAPDVTQPQAELVLRNLQDVLKSNQDTSKLEEITGMNREQLEQFAKKYEKVHHAPADKGREIDVKPEAARKTKAPRPMSDLLQNTSISSRTVRERGGVVQDQIRENIEATRIAAPPEIRSRFEAYKSTLSRSKAGTSRSASGSGGR